MADLERAKQNLCDEFERMPHTRRDLLGNAACDRKIRGLILAYILEGILQNTCEAETRTLMIDSGVLEENFKKEIIPLINAYYKAKELIDAGYCNDLKK